MFTPLCKKVDQCRCLMLETIRDGYIAGIIALWTFFPQITIATLPAPAPGFLYINTCVF